MDTKTSQLQIRVTPDQKRRLSRLARAAGMDVSAWVLSRVLPEEADRFQALAALVARDSADPIARGNLADFLRALTPAAFARAVSGAPRARLDPSALNWLAGGIELAAQTRGLQPPEWTAEVEGADRPQFGSPLASLRLYLLTSAPVALRRRNLFFDSSMDDRV